LWGIWHGCFILIERLLKNKNIHLLQNANPILSRIYTLSIVGIGWILFRASNLEEAVAYLKTMFGISLGKTPGFDVFWYLDKWTVTILIIALLASTTIPQKIVLRIKATLSETVYFTLEKIVILLLFSFCLIRIISGTYNPFIYFQF